MSLSIIILLIVYFIGLFFHLKNTRKRIKEKENVFFKQSEEEEKSLFCFQKNKKQTFKEIKICPKCKNNLSLDEIHRGEQVYIDFLICKNCRFERNISTYWDLGYSTAGDGFRKIPLYHRKIYIIHKEFCPICSREMTKKYGSFHSEIYHCKNNCYKLILFRFYSDEDNMIIEIFGKIFNMQNVSIIDKEMTSQKVQDEINYWKEDEKYLAQVLLNE